MLAFLAVPPVATTREQVAEKPLPTFKTRWWYKHNKLDARPVIWSLKNRPQEWELDSGNYRIIHKPSKHAFWIANGAMFARLDSAECSCTSTGGRFQRFHATAFMRAVRRWRRSNETPPVIHEQFAAHFVR